MKNRQLIRLNGYDYSQNGYYFVTVDTWERQKIFGDIVDNKMLLNHHGIVLRDEILNTPKIRIGVAVNIFQIMPDHWHAIIYIPFVGAQCIAPKRADGNPPVHGNYVGAQCVAPAYKLGNIIGGIKMAVSKRLKINGIKLKVWQRNYYERIIRNEFELNRIRDYILKNPEKWGK